MRAFKNWRCHEHFPTHSLGSMSWEAKKECIRRRDHDGPHRNRYFEWDQDLPCPSDWSLMRLRKTKRPAARAGRS